MYSWKKILTVKSRWSVIMCTLYSSATMYPVQLHAIFTLSVDLLFLSHRSFCHHNYVHFFPQQYTCSILLSEHICLFESPTGTRRYAFLYYGPPIIQWATIFQCVIFIKLFLSLSGVVSRVDVGQLMQVRMAMFSCSFHSTALNSAMNVFYLYLENKFILKVVSFSIEVIMFSW